MATKITEVVTMPYLRVNHTYLCLEDISVFELEPRDSSSSDMVVLKVWFNGLRNPIQVKLNLPHEAIDSFADALIGLIDLAKSNRYLKNVFDVSEVIESAKEETKEILATKIKNNLKR